MRRERTALTTRPTVSARDAYVASCAASLAEAIATKNAALLPLVAHAVALPAGLRCPECKGTAYFFEDGEVYSCGCIAGEVPAAASSYDFRRYAAGEVGAVAEAARDGSGDVEIWRPCGCGIGAAWLGAYDGDERLEVPWVPDCGECGDTGWVFSHRASQQRLVVAVQDLLVAFGAQSEARPRSCSSASRSRGARTRRRIPRHRRGSRR